jgi:hypothetical protein
MAPWLLAAAYEICGLWPHTWADMAYRGQRLRTWMEDACSWILEIVERPRRWGWYLGMVLLSPLVLSRTAASTHC